MSLDMHINGNIPSREDIIKRAESLIPIFKDRALEAEQDRKLPKKNIDDLFNSGLMRIYQPKRYGGYSMGWATHADAARVIARGCPSSAWIVSVVGAHAAIAGRMSLECQDEIWGSNQNQVIVTASAQISSCAVKTKGGYNLSGTWRFASGVDHSEWSIVHSHIDGNDPGDHSKYIRLLVPTSELEIIDTWHVIGMRGTGSKDIKCDNLFVPEYRTINAHATFDRNPPGASINPESYLYEMPFLPYFGSSFLGPLIGASEGAYEAYKNLTSDRKGAIFGNSIKDQVPVQHRLAESSAEIDAAVLIYNNINRVLHEKGLNKQSLSAREVAKITRDRAFIAKLCVSSVNRLFGHMGAVGLYDTNPVHRFYRDVNAMASQFGANWDRNMSIFGKFEFGLPTGDKVIDEVLKKNQ
ncbi:MAG: acyl-CoA dehydrogenase [Rhodospirillaceae bacterium]|nr:acyl-CoA dehydrogenase [Rhodospirillaceae bacterium]|tara:strand:+ start:112 stop:1344 length:1233 start_codon:yes stop_codon:yes gene_type:complete